MSTLYIHCGMQKTGTTAIQHFLAANREVLKQNHAVYPDFSELYDWISAKRNGHWLLKRNQDGFLENGLAHILKLAEQYDKILLSDEQIWSMRAHDPEFWELLDARLRAKGVQIIAVIYLRRQDEYLYSNWAQNVKSMVPSRFKTLTFSQYIEGGYHKMQRLDYDAMLNGIASVLGRENMRVRVYERGQFAGAAHTITSDFLHVVGIPEDLDFTEPETETNISLKDSVLEAKRCLNQLPGFSRTEHVQGDPYTWRLLKVQEELKEEGKLKNRTGFSNAERRLLLKEYEAGNARVAAEFLGRADGTLFYDAVSDTDENDPAYTSEELVEVCGRMILDMQDKIDAQLSEISKLREQKKDLQRRLEAPVKYKVKKLLGRT